MRFACVEYTTKTGSIWRHRPERPNYLADPEREIDPTSFGCYTSALAGEHLPLTGLIYGSLEKPPPPWRRAAVDLRKKVSSVGSGLSSPSSRSRGQWSFSYDLSPLKRFDVFLVIYQTSNDAELVRFVQRLRAERPDAIIASCSSPPFGRLRAQWKDHPETADRYRAFLDASHFNMNVCRATVPWYRLFSSTPSLYLPQPYPVEYALSVVQEVAKPDAPSGLSEARGHGVPPDGGTSARALPESRTLGGTRKARSAGEPLIYVAGDTVRPDIMTGHLIARELQRKFPELLIRVTKTPEFSLNTSFLRGTRYEVIPFRPWTAQLRALAGVRLVINTDLWWTRGRVPVDCAAAGVPCVGTTSDGQTELWPDLAAGDSIEIDRLLALAERALTDRSFRSAVIQKAQRRLQNYTYAQTVARFTRAVELARADRLAEWRDPVWGADDALTRP